LTRYSRGGGAGLIREDQPASRFTRRGRRAPSSPFLSGLNVEINLCPGDLPQDIGICAEYQGAMGSAGTKWGELLRALCVLALFFLNFAHAPVSAAAPVGPVLSAVADSGFCGTPPGDGGSDHAPCHACRIGGGADLPPPHALAVPAFAVAVTSYAACAEPAVVGAILARPVARGPPA
jgi:hypothetical protein